MKDKNGNALEIGDTINCTLGPCVIKEFLENGNPRSGSIVDVEDSNGSLHTVGLKLVEAEKVI